MRYEQSEESSGSIETQESSSNEAESKFDVIVVGAGPVGENVADRAVKAGLNAALIEGELVGGECSYWACMPSKALIRPATALRAAQSVAGSKSAAQGNIDVSAVLQRRDSFTSHWKDDSQVAWVNHAGISLVRGMARLSGPRTVAVTNTDGSHRELLARHAVVLATGSQPRIPAIPGLEGTGFWGTREATSVQELPKSLIVIGGGVAGTELTQIYARLGVAVTQLIRGKLLPAVPQPARNLIRQALINDGVELHEDANITGVERNDSGFTGSGFTVQLATHQVHGEQLLVATGRTPRLADVGLENLGFDPAELAQGKLRTDQTGLVAGTEWLYAVGDAAGKALLTHQGKYEARITGDAIVARAKGTELSLDPWGKHVQTADQFAVPNVVFTDPEVASVGWSVERAKAEGRQVREISLDLAVAGSSLYSDDYQGWAQLVIDEERSTVIGATFIGPDIAELLHSATIAIVGEVPLSRLWHAVPSYPTVSEVWLRLLEAIEVWD